MGDETKGVLAVLGLYAFVVIVPMASLAGLVYAIVWIVRHV